MGRKGETESEGKRRISHRSAFALTSYGVTSPPSPKLRRDKLHTDRGRTKDGLSQRTQRHGEGMIRDADKWLIK